jgi:hypothetical protein
MLPRPSDHNRVTGSLAIFLDYLRDKSGKMGVFEPRFGSMVLFARPTYAWSKHSEWTKR